MTEKDNLKDSTAPASRVGRLVIRAPRSKSERLFAALNSKDDENDLIETADQKIVVTGKNKTGERIYLGEVSLSCFLEKGQPSLKQFVNHIRFCCV